MRPVILSVIGIICLGLAVYANVLNGQFVWDDEALVETNTYIQHWSHLPQIFVKDIGAGSDKRLAFYRPLQILTYMIDHAFWKMDPRGYHLTNMVWHILAALSLYWLILTVFREHLLSFLTAALFAVHPVHTEAVAYISGRADPMALTFMMLSFVFYVKNAPSGRAGRFLLMAACYVCALLSKESAVILPALVLVYTFCLREKLQLRKWSCLVGLALVYIVLRTTVLESMLPDMSQYPPFGKRLPGLFAALAGYIRLLCLPLGLHMEYGSGPLPWSNVKVLAGLVLLPSLIIVAVRNARTNPLVTFAVTWFLVALIPVSNLFPINAFMAEHWLYLPSIGFFLIMARLSCWATRRGNLRIPAVIVTAAVIVSYSVLTVRQNTFWKDPIKLFTTTLRLAPDSPKAHHNLGLAYRRLGRTDEAIIQYRKAIGLEPDYAEAHYNLGIAYKAAGQIDAAAAAYLKAIGVDKNYAKAYNNLGNVYREMRRFQEAVEVLEKAVALDPGYAPAANNLGVAYSSTGRNDKALTLIEKAAALDPAYAEAHNNRGSILMGMDREEEAADSFRKAIALKPDYGSAYVNLGNAYTEMNELENAVDAYKHSLAIAPSARAYYSLGNALVKMGAKDDAAAAYNNALTIDPGHAAAHSNLAIICFQNGQTQDAVRHFHRAKALGFVNPELAEALKPYMEPAPQ